MVMVSLQKGLQDKARQAKDTYYQQAKMPSSRSGTLGLNIVSRPMLLRITANAGLWVSLPIDQALSRQVMMGS